MSIADVTAALQNAKTVAQAYTPLNSADADFVKRRSGALNWHKYDYIDDVNDATKMASVSPKPILGSDARGPVVSNLNPAHYHWAWGEIQAADPAIDPTVKVSGTGSLRLTTMCWSGHTHRHEIAQGGDPANSGGYAGVNFSTDFSTYIGAGEKVYYQWRWRCDQNFVDTVFKDKSGNRIGPKLMIGTVGDFYLGVPFGQNHINNQMHFSDYQSNKFPVMAQGFAPSGLFEGAETIAGQSEFLLENALRPYCTWHSSSFANCFQFRANEWATFKVCIDLTNSPGVVLQGNYYRWPNSEVKVWAAHEGQPSQLLIWWRPGIPGYVPLEAAGGMGAYPVSAEQKYGKVNMMNFLTGLDPTIVFPDCHQWYDELIISREDIPDPQ